MTFKGIKLLRKLSNTKPELPNATDKTVIKLAVNLDLNRVLK